MSISKNRRTNKKEKATNLLKDSQEDTIRMNINVPRNFYKKVKLKAVEEDSTISNLVIKAIENYILDQQ